MSDEKKTQSVLEWAKENGTITGRIPLLPPGDEIRLIPLDGAEAIVPRFPRGRAYFPDLIRNKPIDLRHERKKNFHVDMALVGARDFTRAMRRVSLAVYYGNRIATLLTSDDPRQRKRGARLRQQRSDRLLAGWTDWTGIEERVLSWYDPPETDLRKFYNAQLGEPYDPERYRKD